jgi:L-alanine-DL-glutamate epimerase-like enolase superfamily enzyme
MDIMISCYMSWELEFVCRVAEKVRDCDVKRFEGPLPNGWGCAQYAELRQRISPILVANGNLEYHYKALHDLIEAGANIYSFPLAMATTDTRYAEFVPGGNDTEVAPMFDLLLVQALPIDGRMFLPDTPGFGARLKHERPRSFVFPNA